MCEASKLLLNFFACDVAEIRMIERRKIWRCEASLSYQPATKNEVLPGEPIDKGRILPIRAVESDLERICKDVLTNSLEPTPGSVTNGGNFWTSRTTKPIELKMKTPGGVRRLPRDAFGEFRSVAIYRFGIGEKDDGLLILKSKSEDFFSEEDVLSCQHSAKVLGIACSERRARVALRERVKELACLYDLTKIGSEYGNTLEDVLQQCVRVIPTAWLHTDLASACIKYDGQSFSTPLFEESHLAQETDIIIRNVKRGTVTVAYSEERPELDEGPFLKEERDLLEVIAKELAHIIESKRIEKERVVLQEQLRHADRLATIGQLAAGVSHELNEPLASILGRAQLAAKIPDLPETARDDNEKIVQAALHAREIINKLQLFARRSPARKAEVRLNDIVHNGLYLVQSRCENAGITLVKDLDPDLPLIVGDPGQLCQVLVNLAVNAVQATPDGGSISITTRRHDEEAELCVEDTGSGMDDQTLKQIFTPFFTTKDVNEGTGLGLAVVHGIVMSHGGSITVESTIGKGSRFVVRLPQGTPDESID